MKKILFAMLCLILTVSVAAGCEKKEKEESKKEGDIIIKDDKKVNTSEGIVNEKTIDGFKFEGTTLVTTGEETSFITYMTNKNESGVNINEVEVVMKDEAGTEIIKFKINLFQVVEAGKTIELNSMISDDLTNVKTIDYSIIKADN